MSVPSLTKDATVEVEAKYRPNPSFVGVLRDACSLISCLTITDIYRDISVDAPRFIVADYWLRQRNGQLELKFPSTCPSVSSQQTTYAELDDPSRILQTLREAALLPSSSSGDASEALSPVAAQEKLLAATVPLCVVECRRATYRHPRHPQVAVVVDTVGRGAHSDAAADAELAATAAGAGTSVFVELEAVPAGATTAADVPLCVALIAAAASDLCLTCADAAPAASSKVFAALLQQRPRLCAALREARSTR